MDGSPAGASRIRVFRAGRWAAYWLLVAVIFPVINLSLGLRMFSWLGFGFGSPVFSLLIASESLALRQLVRLEAPGRRIGLGTNAVLVFAATVIWTFVVLLIALSQPNAFTF